MSALVGYRAWSVNGEGDLLSLNQNTSEPWPAKGKKQALCMHVREQAWGPSQLLHSGIAFATTSAIMSSTAYVPSMVQPALVTFAAWWNRQMVAKAVAHHHPPEATCHCGIYAAKGKDRHFRQYREGQAVWGEVYLWGKIQEYSEGYRAEFAYPKQLSTSRPDLAKTIANKYGVPCTVVGKKTPPARSSQLRNYALSTTATVYNIASTNLSTSYLAGASDCDEDEDDQLESSNAIGAITRQLNRRLKKWFV